jgi:hypothetical protein
MPDIYCGHCGEPWEMDTLHDVVSEGNATNYRDAAHKFTRYGCGIMMYPTAGTCTNPVVDQYAADRARVNHIMSPHPDEWME